MKHLVLLGGGHAHLHVLREMAREPFAGAKVTLVTPYPQLSYSGMVPGLVAGHYQRDDAVIPLLPLALDARAEWIEACATGLDAGARRVELSNGRTLAYDVLSIDTGPVIDREAIAGARRRSLFVRPIEPFIGLLDKLWDLVAERTLDIVVIGGGAAGFEVALAIAHRVKSLGSGASRVALVSGSGPALANYPSGVVERGRRALRRAGVTVLPEPCVEIDDAHAVLASGARVACDAPVVCLGTAAPPWLAGSGLALDDRGFIATGPLLSSTSHADVFAAGDVATRTDAPHPRSGVYAVRAGPPLALNLRRAVTPGGQSLQPYTPPVRTLNLLSCGERRAIASWGAFSVEGRWVWRWKDRIDRGFIQSMRSPVSPAAGT